MEAEKPRRGTASSWLPRSFGQFDRRPEWDCAKWNKVAPEASGTKSNAKAKGPSRVGSALWVIWVFGLLQRMAVLRPALLRAAYRALQTDFTSV